MVMTLKADYLELEKAIGLARNPKDHDIGEINTSMKRFGYLERLIINETTGRLIAGHGRIETLRMEKAKGDTAPINIKVEGNKWLIPCDYVQIPEAEEEAAAIALNRLVERGGWDDNMLTKVLSDLASVGENMLDGIGFDMDDVDELIRDQASNEPQEPVEKEPDENSPEMLQEKWGVQDGDIWQVGEHIVACGSCRDLPFLDRVFSGRSAMVAMTSPPYAEQRKKQYGGISEDEYTEWWENVQLGVQKHLDSRGSFFVNIKPHSSKGQRSLYVMDLVMAMVKEWDWMMIDEFCWQRISAPGSWPNRFKNGFEPVYHFAKTAKIKFRPKAVSSDSSGSAMGGSNKAMGNYYNTAEKVVEWENALPSNLLPTFGNATGWGQAAAYPIGLPNFFIRAFSDEGDWIYDPFAGSGSTAVAAHINNRPSIMVEKLPKYVATILERMYEVTGETPERSQYGEN